MALWTTRRAGALGVAAIWLGLAGCSNGTAKPQAAAPDPAKTADAKPGDPKSDAKPDGAAAPPKAAPPTDDPLYHPFVEACLDANNPPLCAGQPPDMTLTNKPTFQLLASVKQHWDDIRFTTPDGKRIQYTAVLETDFGAVEIELRPDLAPNHVRSFVALIQAGYYDGMRFDRIHHEVSTLAPNDHPLDYIEAGHSVEQGDRDPETIGYWLKFENSLPLTHEVGAVGAGRPIPFTDANACSFRIMLSDEPIMDLNCTIFGKVTVGLDKVRTMFVQPVVIEETDPPGHNRPKDPIIIRKATVRTQVIAAAEGK